MRRNAARIFSRTAFLGVSLSKLPFRGDQSAAGLWQPRIEHQFSIRTANFVLLAAPSGLGLLSRFIASAEHIARLLPRASPY